MKVLLVNKFHYLKGGSERVYFDTKKILEENGHQVICFSMKHENNIHCEQSDYFVDNVDYASHNDSFSKVARFIYYKKAAEKLEKLIKQEKPDIAHLHNISHQLTPSILKPLKEAKIPIIQTLHDYQLICPNYRLYTNGNVCEKCKVHRYYECVANKCMRDSTSASLLAASELTFQWFLQFYRERVDLFVSPSEFLKNKLKEWEVKQEVEVLPNFID